VQNYLNGASMFVGIRFLREVGSMPEDYFPYREEVELCQGRGGNISTRWAGGGSASAASAAALAPS
jgi:hypothetical protein